MSRDPCECQKLPFRQTICVFFIIGKKKGYWSTFLENITILSVSTAVKNRTDRHHDYLREFINVLGEFEKVYNLYSGQINETVIVSVLEIWRFSRRVISIKHFIQYAIRIYCAISSNDYASITIFNANVVLCQRGGVYFWIRGNTYKRKIALLFILC